MDKDPKWILFRVDPLGYYYQYYQTKKYYQTTAYGTQTKRVK